MKNLISLITILALCTISYAVTHVYWYQSDTKSYALTANPGPSLPASAVKHGGMIMTSTLAQHSGNSEASFVFGSGLSDQDGRCGVCWIKDLCDTSGSVRWAYVRAEYRDGWSGVAFCNAGLIKIRCGVVDFQGNIDNWGSAADVPASATWQDALNPISGSMGYDMNSPTLMAEEIKSITAEPGRQSEVEDSRLDKRFMVVDVTNQVNWILAHTGSNRGAYSGQYAIVLLTKPGEGSTGKINTMSNEECNTTNFWSDSPWSTDGNTFHLAMSFDNESPSFPITIQGITPPDPLKEITLIPIANPTVNRRPVFQWHVLDSVPLYRLTAGLSPSLASPLFEIPVSDTFYLPTFNLPYDTLYWQVSDHSNTATSSIVSSFRVIDSLQPVITISPAYFKVGRTDTAVLPLSICNTTGRSTLSYSLTCLKKDTSNILIWSYVTSTSSTAYLNTVSAIRQYNPKVVISNTPAVDSNTLRNDLQGKDVFIIPYSDYNSATATHGLAFRNVLAEFTNKGGTLLCLFPSGVTSMLSSANLFTFPYASYTSSSGSTITLRRPSNFLFTGVTSLSTRYLTSYFSVSAADSASVLASYSSYGVVLEKKLGKGRLILLGSNFYTSDNNWSRVLANATLPDANLIPTWVTFSPESGQVAVGACGGVGLHFNDSGLTGGIHTTMLQVWHNSLLSPNPLSIPCTLVVPSTIPDIIPYAPDPTSNRKPVLRWHSVESAGSYSIQIATAPGFISPLLVQPTSDTFYQSPVNLPLGMMYWRVKSDINANYSSVDSFLIQSDSIPTLIPVTPDSITLRRPVLTWHRAVGATTYQIQIDTTGSFISVWLALPVSDTFYVPSINLPHSKICWRVSSMDYRADAYSAVDTFWVRTTTKKESSLPLPLSLDMAQANPNPFNPSTTLRLAVSDGQTPVSVTVYDIKGRTVRVLVNGLLPSGYHDIVFNARDRNGNRLPSGLYLCRMVSGGFQKKIRLVLMK